MKLIAIDDDIDIIESKMIPMTNEDYSRITFCNAMKVTPIIISSPSFSSVVVENCWILDHAYHRRLFGVLNTLFSAFYNPVF